MFKLKVLRTNIGYNFTVIDIHFNALDLLVLIFFL